MIDMFGLYC